MPSMEEHAHSVWLEVSTISPNTKDVMRNPQDKKDETAYACHCLALTEAEVHEEVVRTGKEKFGNEFHMSLPVVKQCRPFNVKPKRRELAMCYKCLRFDMFSEPRFSYIQQKRFCAGFYRR